MTHITCRLTAKNQDQLCTVVCCSALMHVCPSKICCGQLCIIIMTYSSAVLRNSSSCIVLCCYWRLFRFVQIFCAHNIAGVLWDDRWKKPPCQKPALDSSSTHTPVVPGKAPLNGCVYVCMYVCMFVIPVWIVVARRTPSWVQFVSCFCVHSRVLFPD